MNDSTRAHYEEAVRAALLRNGVADPAAALCALLWLLRGRHRREVIAFAVRAYREGFELPDPGACTTAETMQNEAACLAGIPEDDEPMLVPDAASLAPALRAAADVLAQLIPLWDVELMDEAASAAAARVIKRDGTAAPGHAG